MAENYQENLARIKAKYPKAYLPWTGEDDRLLQACDAGGMGIEAIAESLQRQPNAIRSRLRKLRLRQTVRPESENSSERLVASLPVYRRYIESSEHLEDRRKRQERQALYVGVLSPETIDLMTELEFGQVISSMWASQMWGNKSYLVDKLIQENGLPALRAQLKQLLWETENIAAGYDVFRKKIKGFGTAMITEILAFVHPTQYGIWNERARTALKQLGAEQTLPFLHKTQLTGQEYERFIKLVATLVDGLKNLGFADMDYLGLNYFFFEICQVVKPETVLAPVEPVATANERERFNHSDTIEQLIAIGQALGFQTEKEKWVARGAKVDVVWQARIANLGVVMYVFEVQSHGSIDSLILNLQRAQNNQSVQRLIVVASSKDIEQIRGEIASLAESFRMAVSYLELAEVFRAADLVGELFEIINKLELVKSEFGLRQ